MWLVGYRIETQLISALASHSVAFAMAGSRPEASASGPIGVFPS